MRMLTVAVKKPVKKKQHTKRSPYKARGISKIALVGIVAVLLVGVGGVFYFTQHSSNGANSALPFVKPPLNPNCKYNDPDLCKFLNNFPTQTSYTVTSKGTYDGTATESLYEISGEEKFHMVTKLNGKEDFNTITIGDTTYTLDYSDNKWWKHTNKPDTTTNTTSSERLIDENTIKNDFTEDKSTYKFIAKESCAELMCFKYEMTTPDATDTKTFMWFDDRDYLMRKMLMEDKSGMTDESTYSYNNVVITAPSPVKEGTPNNFGNNPEVNDAEIQKMMKQYKEQVPSEQSPFDSEAPVEYNAPEEY